MFMIFCGVLASVLFYLVMNSCFPETIFDDGFYNDQRDLSRSVSLEPSPGRISNISKQIALLHKSSNDMKACLTMWDNTFYSRPNNYDNFSSGWLMGSGVLVGE